MRNIGSVEVTGSIPVSSCDKSPVSFKIQGFFIFCVQARPIHAFPAIDNMGAIDALFLMIGGGLGWGVPVQGGIGA